MPYLRLHLPEVPIQQKRIIAQKLIEVTMRTFRLRPEERYQVSVEFVSEREPEAIDSLADMRAPNADCVFEVMGHNLTEETKRAFGQEAAAVLTPFLPAKLKLRVARWLGVKPSESRQIAFQFGELSPAVSEPFVVHSGWKAA